jgi:aryl-alcohol dehydrogenase-like predicted oxidoreductase
MILFHRAINENRRGQHYGRLSKKVFEVYWLFRLSRSKDMKFRPLGNTGLWVSEIGLGAWQLGNAIWGCGDEGQALRIVASALDVGCNFFDTAPGYSEGRSETLLGRALSGCRDKAIICSKFGHSAEGATEFSVSALRPAVEESLRRLRSDYVDVLLLHNPPVELLDGENASDLYAELCVLRKEGKLRTFGASVDWGGELLTLSKTTQSQAAEILFNVFHQEPRSAFAIAADHGVGLIAKVPLDSGWLSGKYDASSVFEGVRSRWPRSVIEQRASLVEQLRKLLPAGLSLPQAALRFVLSHPEISSVIPGAKDVAQVHANVAAAGIQLPADTVAAMRQLWEKNLQACPLPW